jgi:hypothetical protein
LLAGLTDGESGGFEISFAGEDVLWGLAGVSSSMIKTDLNFFKKSKGEFNKCQN